MLSGLVRESFMNRHELRCAAQLGLEMKGGNLWGRKYQNWGLGWLNKIPKNLA